MKADVQEPRSERGTSTLEVVAAVALLTLVMGAVFAGMHSMQGAVAGSEERLQNLDEARQVMAVTSRDLRTAVRLGAGQSPFVYAAGNEAIFHANLDTEGAPKKVRIYIDDDDRLVEEVWQADQESSVPLYTYSGAPDVRLVGRYLDNDDAAPLFTYALVPGADARRRTGAGDAPCGGRDRPAVPGAGGTNSNGNIVSGLAKGYSYDQRLKYLSPPRFLDPVASAWGVATWAEVDVPDAYR